MKAAFKWRLQNGIYGYITDEDNQNGPFAYDISDRSRIYPDGTIETGATVNEGKISTIVSKFSRDEYINAFNSFKAFINESYPQVSLLDVMYYYNIENDECTVSASSLKCSATDIIFDATAVEGSELSVVVTNEQTDPNTREALRYRLDFTFPNTTPSGVEYTAGDNIDITTGNTISALGYRYNQDKDSIAVGSGSVGLGMWSHAEGYGTQANGTASHAEGSASNADGNYSHAEGEGCIAGEANSHAEGFITKANGVASHTEGYSTQANVMASHAEGLGTQANGEASHAEGIGTKTNNSGEHAEGKYNISNSGTTSSIGIGTSDDDRKNAFEVMENGDVYVYNVGDYDGTNAIENDTKTLQEVLEELSNSGSGGDSGITYVGGNNIEITGNTITAKGYTYNNDNDTETLEFSDNILSLGDGFATIHYDADERRTTFTNADGLYLRADGEMSITNTSSDINVTTSEGNINITAKTGGMDISAYDNMNISAEGQIMNISVSSGDMDISAHNNMYISAQSGMNITVSNNFSVDSSSFSSTCPITAEVNGVENVYLGCPIGTIVMWAGQTAPNGWFLCDGSRILTQDNVTTEQTIQDKTFNSGELQNLIGIIGDTYGAGKVIHVFISTLYNAYINSGYIKTVVWVGTNVNITELTGNIEEAYTFDSIPDWYLYEENPNYNIDVTTYYYLTLPNLQQRFPLGAMQGGAIGSDSGGTPYNTNLGDTGGEAVHTLTVDEMPEHSHDILHGESTQTSKGQGVSFTDLSSGYESGTGSDNNYPIIQNIGGSQPHNNIPPFLAINFIIKYK